MEERNILYNGQIVFCKKCRTSDHILTLKNLIDKAFKSSTRLYACFVDLKKAFDTVNRKALMHKISGLGINRNFLNIMEDMYREVKYSIKMEEGISDELNSKVGLKQGCILSPSLFSLYINDLSESLDDQICDSPKIDLCSIPCLLYADDIVLLSESAKGLQFSLNRLHQYCSNWDLQVNINKTKVMIFNKGGRLLKNTHFKFDGNYLNL